MALSKKQRSTRRLNNKGVFFLEAGRYEDAARCFAMSITSSPSSRLQWQTQAKTKKRAPLVFGRETSKPRNEPTAEPPTCIPPILKDVLVQTQQEETPPEVLTAYTLGRPLWIRSKQQRMAALDSKVLSATLLYNLGLSFHLMAIREAEITRRLLHARKALCLYKLAEEALMKVPLSITMQSPAFAVVLHNMSHVHSAMTESHGEASKYQGRLATVLRLMRASCGQKQYETCFIKILSLPKGNFPAAAA